MAIKFYMKKKCSLLFVCLWLFACLFACDKETESKPLMKGQPYSFTQSTCIVNEDLTVEDLKSYFPIHVTNRWEVTTLEEFEIYILENLEKLKIKVKAPEGYKEIYFANTIETIQIFDTVCTITTAEDSVEQPYKVEKNVYTIEEFSYPLVYENGRLYYEIEYESVFAVRHYFS